jgi:hypothetical protein
MSRFLVHFLGFCGVRLGTGQFPAPFFNIATSLSPAFNTPFFNIATSLSPAFNTPFFNITTSLLHCIFNYVYNITPFLTTISHFLPPYSKILILLLISSIHTYNKLWVYFNGVTRTFSS